MAKLYNVSLDELIEFDIDIKEIEEVIKNTNEEKEAKINWTNAWSKKYPVLAIYQKKLIYQSMRLKLEKCLIIYVFNMATVH